MSATWNITLDPNPKNIAGGETASVELDVTAPDGTRPATGTSMQVTVNRGIFATTGTTSTTVVLSNGKSAVEVIATSTAGTTLVSGEIRVTASLQGSSNSTRINVTDAAGPVQASFGFTVAGFSVGFDNQSTGATTYRWDFGDGSSSSQEEPSHTYAGPGEYLVSLTASNQSNEDTTFATITLGEEEGGV